MKVIDADEAQANFLEYLACVEAGETIVITRCGKPVARLLPTEREAARRRPVGLAKGMVQLLPEFFEPLDEELLGLFEGTRMLPSDPLNPDWDPDWRPDKGNKTG
jgi:prevent-host-death family protein